MKTKHDSSTAVSSTKAPRSYVGLGLFIILWPILWFIAPLQRRVRCLLVSGDELLVVRNRFGWQKWQLAGGGIKQGESIEQSAIRELHEELGLTVAPESVRLLNAEPIMCRQFGLLFPLHFVEIAISKDQRIDLSYELCAATWVDPSQQTGLATEVTLGSTLG